MKILSVNAGSSSLKFQLISMPLEKKISSGTIERIGNKKSKILLFFNGSKVLIKEPIQDHNGAVMRLTELLIENKILDDKRAPGFNVPTNSLEASQIKCMQAVYNQNIGDIAACFKL